MPAGPAGSTWAWGRRTPRAAVRAAAVALAAISLATCSHSTAWVHPALQPATQPASVAYRLLLIGDAGEPKNPEPVLTAARDWASRIPGKTAVLFLGDNVYPRGFIDRRLADAEGRIARQVEAVDGLGAEITFLPGNHDWDKGGTAGLVAVERQEAFLRARGIGYQPPAGCPGPAVLDYPPGDAVIRVIVLDTQWWLHGHEKKAGCTPGTEDGVVAALAAAADTPLPIVVAAHHPLASHGPHGGFYDWRAHVFPLGDAWAWGKYVPLPIIGSLYPLSRTLAHSPQDLASATNRAMREAFTAVLRAASRPALRVFAAGHEHSLQVLTHDAVDFALVSGAGSSHHHTPVATRSNTLFALADDGFMVLDVVADGVHLTVVSPSTAGGSHHYLLRRAPSR